MAKTAKPSRPSTTRPERTACPDCGRPMRADSANRRTVATLAGLTRLTLTIRRCPNRDCRAYQRPYRPEAEGRYALPRHEFGLDVLARVGRLRHAEYRSVPEIHRDLIGRGLGIAERTVTNLLDRYDELVAVRLADDRRLRKVLAGQGKVILAIDGLQPDVGHEILWVLRDCLSGEVRWPRTCWPGAGNWLTFWPGPGRGRVPILAVVSDGQHAIRGRGRALPGVPTNSVSSTTREAARPIFGADRHAKKGTQARPGPGGGAAWVGAGQPAAGGSGSAMPSGRPWRTTAGRRWRRPVCGCTGD